MSADVAQQAVYVIQTEHGFTETFTERQVETLVTLGLLRHEKDTYLLSDGNGNPVGPVHRFFGPAV